MFKAIAVGSMMLALGSGAQAASPEIPVKAGEKVTLASVASGAELPALRWDHVAGSRAWTEAVMTALEGHGAPLVDTVPADIAQWCPAYPKASEWERKAFWAGLLSTLAKHESTYRPTAVGGDGKWVGLVQILPATARGYGCKASTRAALKDGSANMSCAVRILAQTVPRDGVVSAGMKGVAADWGPFHSTSKREDMRQWISAQPFCDGSLAVANAKPAKKRWWDVLRTR